MSTLHITIKMDNAAFTDNEGPEAARILREYAAHIDDGCRWDAYDAEKSLRDLNGNTVGEAKVTK
jgi:hypothetical protein